MASAVIGTSGRSAPSPKSSPRIKSRCHGSSLIVLPVSASVPPIPRMAAAKCMASAKWGGMPSCAMGSVMVSDGNPAQVISSQSPRDVNTQPAVSAACIQAPPTASVGDAVEQSIAPAEEASKHAHCTASMPSLSPWPTVPTAVPKTGDLNQHSGERIPTSERESLSAVLANLPHDALNTPRTLSSNSPGCKQDPDRTKADEVSEEEMRRALRALTFFFTDAQIRAIVATPTSHYASVAIPNGDAEKQPSSVTRSLRVALRLLGLNSLSGKKFRKLLSSEETQQGHDGELHQEHHQQPRPRLRRHTDSSPLHAAQGLVPKLQLTPHSSQSCESKTGPVPTDSRQSHQISWPSPAQRCTPTHSRQADSLIGSRGAHSCRSGSIAVCPQERQAEGSAPQKHDGDLRVTMDKNISSGATGRSAEEVLGSCSATTQRAPVKTKGLPSTEAVTPKTEPRTLSPKGRISPSLARGKQHGVSPMRAQNGVSPMHARNGVSPMRASNGVSPMRARFGGQAQRMQPPQSRCSPSRRASVQETARHSITRRGSPMRWSGGFAMDAPQQQQGDGAETALSSSSRADNAFARQRGQESPVASIAVGSVAVSLAGVGVVSHDQQRTLGRSQGSHDLLHVDVSPEGCETKPVSTARLSVVAAEDRRNACSPPRLLGSRPIAKSLNNSPNKHSLQAQSQVPSAEGVLSLRMTGTSPVLSVRDTKPDPRKVASPSPPRTRTSQSPPRARGKGLGLEHYAVGKMLGKGAFGKVNVGVHKLTEELTAMKLCERKLISHSQAKKCLMQEVNILRRVNGHANIIQLLEVIETDTALVLVMEFAASGDLLRYVRQHRKLAEDCAQGLFKQLLDGLDHIHKMCVVHRDIKLENLLLDSFGCLKIADFGVATLLKCPEQRLDDHCGTPSYIAPEVLLDHGYQGPPVDMWSAGIVLYAMLVGHAPFKADHLLDLRRNILRGRYHTPAHLSEEAANLLRRLLIVEPSNRATLGEAADHAWLRKVDNPAIGVYGPAGMLGKGATCLEHFEDLLGRMDDFGFPRDHLEESLGQGKLNRATATFYLLAQQKLRRRALDTGATMITAVGSSLSAAAASICTPRGERSDNERP